MSNSTPKQRPCPSLVLCSVDISSEACHFKHSAKGCRRFAVMNSLRETLSDYLRIETSVVREALAEFIGTFFLLLIGNSANIQNRFAPGGNSTSAHLAWGFGFAFAVYLAANVSGAHLNPAISLTAFILGNISLLKVLLFTIAQVLGAFVGAAIAFLGHLDDLNNFANGERLVTGPNGTAGLFATYPSEHMSIAGSLFDQIIGTAILSGCVLLITDKRHRIPSGMVPALAGLIMSMIAMTFGANGGFAINPARDLGPRLFTLCAGYGWEVFSANSYYFWIPIVGPYIGAILGAWIYKLFVGLHGLNEDLEITGGQPYPRSDKGYKVSAMREFTHVAA
uniref:Aquaporin-9 n=1 Tax=Steinernema glaseri TaxID=37863 RepID=A0A1I8A7Q2_9BILA